MQIRFTILSLLTFLSFAIFAQSPRWTPLSGSDIERLDLKNQQFTPNSYKLYAVDFETIESFLHSNLENSFILEIPFPDGSVQEFRCDRAALIPDGLQSKYPSILSFDGKGISNRASKMKFGISPKGFHAMVLRPGSSSVFVDIYSKGLTDYYMSYYKKDYEPVQSFVCDFESDNIVSEPHTQESFSIAGDCQLRSYRLALACSGEYATFHGGTKQSTLAEFAVAMARVNGIYETDLGITMIFVDNTDEVIFLDGTTDPYTNNSGGAMLGENQETLDDIIGSANYDIGHVFSTGGGGIAALQSPCNNNRKAQGVTGLPSPINDPFYVDYVSHEMGHQYGANHTQNNDCNRVGATAMEVGSANTIMGYAGICAPNSKNNSDDHFHAISIQEMSNYIVNGNGNSCTELIANDNTPPSIIPGQSVFSIPANTPFMLSVDASDDDGDILSYCWEQMDNEIADMPPALTNTGGPSFISNSPLLSETRFFPNLNAIVNNLTPEWEVLPGVTRQMNFRVTVRDNHSMLGCTNETNVELNVDGETGPFLVEYPNAAEVWQSTDEETVLWDVANTDGGDVNCMLVDILLSIDGGFTYPITLAQQVPNDGSHSIVVPAEFTTTARVMVKCSDNVFFDISNTNFTIETPFTFALDQEEVVVCQGDQVTIEISTAGFNGFADEIEFSLENLPSEVEFNFSANPVNTPESTNLNLTNINAEPGSYDFNVLATAAGISISKNVKLLVQPSTIDNLALKSPINGSEGVGNSAVLSWSGEPGITSYELTVSKSPDFVDPVLMFEIDDTSAAVSDLDLNTVYYWKVRANTICSSDTDSELFAFQTEREGICDQRESDDIPLDIPGNLTGDFTSTLMIEDVTSFDYVTCFIDLEHTYLGDIVYTLISPQGTELILMDQIGVPGSEFGCSSDDIAVTFSDLSINSAEMLEDACGSYESSYQPVDPFSTIMNEDVNGEWMLVVSDVFAQDGGEVASWNIEFCSAPTSGGPDLVNNLLVVPFAGERTVTPDELEIESADPVSSIITMLSAPQHGQMMQFNPGTGEFEMLNVGSTFNQFDINEGNIVYEHSGDDATADAFQFDALDGVNRWTHNETFNILIAEDGEPIVNPFIDAPILCNGDSTASIVVEILAGNGPFQYSNDGGTSYQSDSVFTDLAAGTYNIVVLDVNGLEIYNNEVTIDQATALIAGGSSIFYDIVVNGSGGSPSYTYSINGIDFFEEPIFEDVAPGVYTIVVRDAFGCESTIEVSHEYEALALNFESIDVICFGESTGSVDILSVGGFSPYTYSIDGVDFDDISLIEDLAAGSYTFYIQDGGGMVVSQEVTITEGEQIEFTLDGDVSSFSVENVTGGTSPYQYSLDDVDYSDSPLFDPLPQGDFTIYVRDVNGCTQSLTYNEIGAEITSFTTLCIGEATGSFEADGFGGFPPLSYSLDGVNFQDSGDFSDLAEGQYTLTVMDEFGFSNTFIVDIESPDPITVATEYIGGELIITATGGTGSYMYSIDGGASFQSSNIFTIDMDGEYPIVVIDSNDCVDESMLTLTLVNNQETELETMIEIYPIPVHDNLLINLDPSLIDQVQLQVYNAIGQELNFIAERDNNQMRINFSTWPVGQYVLVIQSDQGIVTKKVLKF